MSAISFFEAVSFNTKPTTPLENLTELVDSYFYLGGRIAYVLNTRDSAANYEIYFSNGNPIWWRTTLKIISYFTLVIPLILLTVKAILRSQSTFNQCTNSPPHSPSSNGADSTFAKAPLIMVRSQKDTDLKISILYTSKITPREPIVPSPSQISSNSKYTWEIVSHSDGTMSSKLPNQSFVKINMIWWEATRKEISHNVDLKKSTCIQATHLKEFLASCCKRLGVTDAECEAFTSYWNELFSKITNCVLVQWIEEKDLPSYLPDLEVESEEEFTIQRGYFRFQPTDFHIASQTEQVFLNTLPSKDLGPNAVIDLGGEIVEMSQDSRWAEDLEFNKRFAEQYIYCK